MKTKYYLIGLLIMSSTSYSFMPFQADPWTVPEKDAKIRNPVKRSDPEALKLGKELWIRHCATCHGAFGDGRGPKAGQLKTEMKNMTSAYMVGQSDGALYYKIAVGRGEMPSYKEKIPNSKEIWSIVNYIRSLKK